MEFCKKKECKTCMWALAHSHGLKLEKDFPQLLQQLLPTVWISSLVLHNFQPIPKMKKKKYGLDNKYSRMKTDSTCLCVIHI